MDVPRRAARSRAAPRWRDGKLYFGTYGGHVYAIAQRSGKQVWHAGTSGANFGLSAGNFYATPAVAYGRVYIGNTDGNMYSFSAEPAASSPGGAGPAPTSTPRRPSPRCATASRRSTSAVYDGTFYALDARTGATRWTHRDGGKISGAATVVGDIVYYSNWGKRDTTGLWARSGKMAWHSERGAFNPVVSDGQTIYVTGFSSIGAFVPKTAAEERATDGAAGEEGGEGEGGQEAQGGEEEGAPRRRRRRRRRRRARPPKKAREGRRAKKRRQRNNSG